MAIDRVQKRLDKTTATLSASHIPYAVIGGNAVAEWVGRVDEGAVRFTKDVDILIRREDLSAAIEVMRVAGFVHHCTMGVDMFLDGPDAKPSEAVHLLFAGEKVKEADLHVTPLLDEVEIEGPFPVVSLEALVRMKLTSFRDKDRMHLRDMIGVGLIDRTFPGKYPSALAARLTEILDTPEENLG